MSEEEEYNIENEKIGTLIPELRNFLKEKYDCDDISEHRNDFLARCLRIKNGNLEKAAKFALSYKPHHEKIVSWKISVQPSYYANSHFGNNILFPLNIRDSLGRRVYIFQNSKWDPNQLSAREMLLGCGMLMHYALANNIPDQINGLVIILDYEGLSLQQVLALRDFPLMKMAMDTQKGKLGKLAAIHVVNHPKVFSLLYAFAKPFLSNKMKQRVFFHRGLTSLHENLSFDPRFLSKCLGGERETDECVDKELVADLVKSDAFFADMMKTGYPSR